MSTVHTPVMKQEVLELLAPVGDEALMIDCTLGEGGHAEAFLEAYPGLRLVGLDADRSMVDRASNRLGRFGDRFVVVHAWFDEYLARIPTVERPMLILFDLGISMVHYQVSGRGFSFHGDEPLDMRLDSDSGPSAADLVNRLPENELADLLFAHAEERYSRRIAAAVVRERMAAPILTTDRLANVIARAVPAAYRHGRIHPATRCFQALRIGVNRELERLEAALRSAFSVVSGGGRIGVISFHSLEDRIVKRRFREWSGRYTSAADLPKSNNERDGARARLLTKKPLVAGPREVAVNPASRSAKLRVIEKTEVAE